MEKVNEYVRSQSMAAGEITNDDLVCKNCLFRGRDLPTAYCFVFRKEVARKPNVVLLGGKCPVYRKVNNGK